VYSLQEAVPQILVMGMHLHVCNTVRNYTSMQLQTAKWSAIQVRPLKQGRA
jgi:hypothetical protein